MLFQSIASRSSRQFGPRFGRIQGQPGAVSQRVKTAPAKTMPKTRPGAEDRTILAHAVGIPGDERAKATTLRPISGWDDAAVRVRLAQKRADAIASIKQRIAMEQNLLLQDGTHTQLMLQPTPTGKGTAVLFHGWSAGTWQYEELAPELYRKGYDIYIPRLPGHGFRSARGVADPQFLPKSGEFDAYRRFANEIFEDVRHLGGPIKLVGLSGGGAVALDIATRHPEVKAVVAMAPFMGIPKLEKFAPIFDLVDRLWFGLGHSVLDRIPYGWGKDAVRTPSFHEFKLGNITAARRYGMRVGRNLPASQVPTQLITTAVDQSASNAMDARWFRKGMPARSGWYEFPASAKVPHPMIGKPNNPDDALRAQIRAMITHYLETSEPRQRLPE